MGLVITIGLTTPLARGGARHSIGHWLGVSDSAAEYANDDHAGNSSMVLRSRAPRNSVPQNSEPEMELTLQAPQFLRLGHAISPALQMCRGAAHSEFSIL